MKVWEISKENWATFSEGAHRVVFEKEKPAYFDRIDYGLIAVTGDDIMAGYVTVREVDHETVYWQFGGGFPWAQKSILMAKAYDALLAHQAGRSKRMTTFIENVNVPMLKLALSRGLKICGLRLTRETTLVEFVKEW